MPKEYAKKSPPRKNPIRYTPIQFIPRAGIYVILFHFNLKQTRHIRLREVNLQRLAVVIVMEHITACFRVNAGNLQLFPWECSVQRNFKISLSAASPYTKINHIPRHADSGCEVLVLIIRPSHRPERNAVLDAAADLFVAVNSLFYKFKPLRRNFCEMAALVNTKQQRIDHIENNFLFVPSRSGYDQIAACSGVTPMAAFAEIVA